MRLNLTEIAARLSRTTVDESYLGEAAALLRALRETRAALRECAGALYQEVGVVADVKLARTVLERVDD